jgi:hypothetical protein
MVRGSRPDGLRPGRRSYAFPASHKMIRAQGRTVCDGAGSSSSSSLEPRSRHLGEEILGHPGSTRHSGRPTTWSRLGIKRSIRERNLGWTTRSCPPGGVRSQDRLGVGRPPKTDLDDVESNRGGGGYAEGYN